MSAKSSRPPARASQRPPAGGGGVTPSQGQEYQVDIGRVIQRYRQELAQASEGRIVAQAAQDQLLEENTALQARIAELEAAQVPSTTEAEPAA
jgi:hypothetical protein